MAPNPDKEKSKKSKHVEPVVPVGTVEPGAASLDLFEDTLTSPPLSESVMDVLAEMGKEEEKDLDEKYFGSAIEHDRDPSYVPDPDDSVLSEDSIETYDMVSKSGPSTPAPHTPGPAASTSTPGFKTPTGPFRVPIAASAATASRKRNRHESEPLGQQKALFKSPLKLLKGARSDNPIYAFFLVDDIMTTHPVSGVKTVAQKSVVCQILVGGAPCGTRLKQTGSTTSSLRSHIHSKHKKAEVEYNAELTRMDAEVRGELKKIGTLFKQAEGFPEGPDDDDFEDIVDGKSIFVINRLKIVS